MLIESIRKEHRNFNNLIKKERLEGKLERNKEVARLMLLKGLDINLIKEITQLSKEEIEKLRD